MAALLTSGPNVWIEVQVPEVPTCCWRVKPVGCCMRRLPSSTHCTSTSVSDTPRLCSLWTGGAAVAGAGLDGPIDEKGMGVNPANEAVSVAGRRVRSQLSASEKSGAWFGLLLVKEA